MSGKMRVALALLAMFVFAACQASGLAEMGYTQIDQETAKQMMALDDGHVVVDVRTREEYDGGHIPGAILIPNETIGDEPPEALPDVDQIILVYCRSGNRSRQAAQKLADMGYANVYELGGINTWTGERVTTEEETAAELCFSSFSGGGYTYVAEADDPSVVRCESRYVFEEHAEEIDGAAYDFIVSVAGLKPGETVVRVYGSSPIAEDAAYFYMATVDDGLRVVLTPVRALSYLYLYRNGEIRYDSYQITRDAEGWHVSVNEEPERPISPEAADALMRAIDAYDLVSWDGFSESNAFVLDGEGFWLDFTLTDGTRVHARGDNAFPEHYFEAMGELWDILSEMSDADAGVSKP